MPTKIISENTIGSYPGDYTGVIDTYIDSGSATTNFGSAATCYNDSNAVQHGLIAFTGLSNIPASATITGVTLGFYRTTTLSAHTADMRVCLRNWVESEATWNIFNSGGGNSWTTAGCLSNGNDRVTALTVNFDFTSSSGWKTSSDANLVSDVQDFVDGTTSNYGWHLEAQNTDPCQYRSSEGTDGERPYLSVTYTESASIPIFMHHYLQNIGN